MPSRFETGPSPRRTRLHPALPFVLPGGLGSLLVLVASRDSGEPLLLALAGVLLAATLAASFVLPWDRLPQGTAALVPLAFLGETFLLLEGSGAAFFTVAPLLLLPLLWLALYGTRPQLLAAGAVALPATLLHDLHHGAGAETLAFQLLFLTVAAGLCAGVEERTRRGSARVSRFARMANTDPLTGVPNRRAWDYELELALAHADRTGTPLCVLLIDFDHFKRFNDSRGHQAGDDLLRETTALWKGTLRGGDLLVRYGGEEFAVLLPDCGLEVATGVGERLRTAVPLGQTCSVGIACWDGEETAEELVSRADAALYAAKEAGRDAMRVSAPGQAATAALPETARERANSSSLARVRSSSSS